MPPKPSRLWQVHELAEEFACVLGVGPGRDVRGIAGAVPCTRHRDHDVRLVVAGPKELGAARVAVAGAPLPLSAALAEVQLLRGERDEGRDRPPTVAGEGEGRAGARNDQLLLRPVAD